VFNSLCIRFIFQYGSYEGGHKYDIDWDKLNSAWPRSAVIRRCSRWEWKWQPLYSS